MKSLSAWLVAFALAGAVLVGCGGSGSSGSSAASGSAAAGSSTGTSQGSDSSLSAAQKEAQSQAPPPDYAETHLSFGAAPLGASQRSTLAKTGVTTIPVKVPKAGTVSGFGQAEIDGAIVKAAKATPVTASGASTVDLHLRLTPVTRKALAHGRPVLMYVAIDFSGSRTLQRLTVPLQP